MQLHNLLLRLQCHLLSSLLQHCLQIWYINSFPKCNAITFVILCYCILIIFFSWINENQRVLSLENVSEVSIAISALLCHSEFHLSLMFKLMLKSIRFKNMDRRYQKYFQIVVCTSISVSTRDTCMCFHTILVVSEASFDTEVPNIFGQFYRRWFFWGVWTLFFI